jgi:type IV secretory pathway TrbL component
MVHIKSAEVKYVAETVLGISGIDYAEVERIIPLIEQSCSAAGAMAISEKADSRSQEYQNDVVKMEAQLAEMPDGDDKTKFASRLENNRKQANEKIAAAATAKTNAALAAKAAEEASGVAFVSWPLFVTMVREIVLLVPLSSQRQDLLTNATLADCT